MSLNTEESLFPQLQHVSWSRSDSLTEVQLLQRKSGHWVARDFTPVTRGPAVAPSVLSVDPAFVKFPVFDHHASSAVSEAMLF